MPKIIRISGATAIFHEHVPIIVSSTLLGLPLTGTDFGFSLEAPVIRSILYFVLAFDLVAFVVLEIRKELLIYTLAYLELTLIEDH